MDTLLFYSPKSSYRNLFRGVAECYAFSRFHDNVGLRHRDYRAPYGYSSEIKEDPKRTVRKENRGKRNFCQRKRPSQIRSAKNCCTINDWLERLKRYNLDIHICGDRNSYSKTDPIDLYLEKILFKTFRQMER